MADVEPYPIVSIARRGGSVAPRLVRAPSDPPVFSLPDTQQRTTDRRYHTKRWQRLRLRVLDRDGWLCRVAPGCRESATVADHIIAVYDGMPDALFFDPGNLRASCRGHNLARGLTEHLQSDPNVVTKDYSR